jgi:hypothetical protein
MQIFRWLFFAQLLLSSAVVAQQQAMPKLPPISPSATGERLPGKFVWADLFSSDVEASSKFYERVFDWEAQQVKASPKPYAIFYKDELPIAGLAYRQAPDGDDVYGRWIHYLSVDDVDETQKVIVENAGRILLNRRSYPDRGDFAIVADAHDAPFGIIHSSSGDPGDYRAAFGEWIWRQLFTRDLDKSIRFYTGLFGYKTEKEERNPQIMNYLLRSQGYLRAGIGYLGSDPEVAPAWLGYIRVEDIDKTLGRVMANGGKVLLEPTQEIADGGLAIVSDPTGASIGLLRWDYKDSPDAEAQP